MIGAAFVFAALALLWALFAIAVPFEEGGGSLCIGDTLDVLQQAVAVIGLALSIAAFLASIQGKARPWVIFTAATVATFVLWQIGTQVAAEANC